MKEEEENEQAFTCFGCNAVFVRQINDDTTELDEEYCDECIVALSQDCSDDDDSDSDSDSDDVDSRGDDYDVELDNSDESE